MTKHRSHSAAFKRQVAEEFIAGETLHALSKRHDISRQLIRIWVGKFEAGVLDDDVQAADLIQEYEAKIAALERMVGRQALEIELLRTLRTITELGLFRRWVRMCFAGIPDFDEQAYARCMIDEDAIRYRWDTIGSKLDERGRRLFAAAEVRTAGWGGLAIVSRITGLARSTINRGDDDLDGEPLAKGKVRRAGGGRRAVAEVYPGLIPELARLVEPATLGDPMRPLTWVSKSMDKLAETLTAMGHRVSADTVRKELVKLGFSRQFNRKSHEGSNHPDRDAQFEHINAKVVAAQANHQPVISVDTKKKELDWRLQERRIGLAPERLARPRQRA